MGCPMPDDVIDSFSGEYRFLSNFFPSELPAKRGVPAKTVEHAYQACKSKHYAEQQAVLRAPTPGEAKKLGRTLTLRPDWEEIKVDVMERLVTTKFLTYPDLAAKLLLTGDALLVEGNTWGDRFWGMVDNQGENNLGIILMKVRATIAEASK